MPHIWCAIANPSPTSSTCTIPPRRRSAAALACLVYSIATDVLDPERKADREEEGVWVATEQDRPSGARRRLGRGRAAGPRLRGRHHLLPVGGSGEARIEESARSRDRQGRDHRLQPGRDDSHNLRPHDHGLQKGPRPQSRSSHPRRTRLRGRRTRRPRRVSRLRSMRRPRG